MHLFVTLTNPCNNGLHLLVPICSIKPERFHDATCIIKSNDNVHIFINRDSYVSYKDIQARHAVLIDRCLSSGAYVDKPPDISSAWLQKICDGVVASDFCPQWAQMQFQNWPS